MNFFTWFSDSPILGTIFIIACLVGLRLFFYFITNITRAMTGNYPPIYEEEEEEEEDDDDPDENDY